MILQSRAILTEHIALKLGETMTLIGKMAVICRALANLSNSIAPIE